jgi:hypothetical protein
MKDLKHRLTIEITSSEMRKLTDKAAKRGYLPVAYLKYLALSPETQYYTANDFQAIEKELE